MELDKKNMKRIMLIVAFGIILFIGIMKLYIIIDACAFLYQMLSPIIMGLCIAFVLNILMRLFEEKIFKFLKKSKYSIVRKLCRPLSLLLTFAVALGVIALVLIIIIPQVIDAINMVAIKFPIYANNIYKWANNQLESWDISVKTIADMQFDWENMVNKAIEIVKSSSTLLADSTITFTTSIFSGLFEIVIAIIISVYVLLRKERIGDIAVKSVKAYFPQKLKLWTLKLAALSSDAFSRFIRGQAIEACILGTLCFIGMKLFKFPYAASVSVLIGVTALIPMLGAWIGGVVGGFLILMVSPIKAILFIVYLLILQQIENNLIYPRVVGESIGLPGLLVLCAVVIGNSITGVAGILISVPLCSVLYTLLKEGIDKRLGNGKDNLNDTNAEPERAAANNQITEDLNKR